LGAIRFIAVIETSAALEHLGAIARSSSRLVSLAIGSEDLSTDLDAEPTPDALYVAKMLGIHAARAAGLLPMGLLASVAGIDGDDAYKTMLRRSRALGFACASCVYPAQVAMINDVFGPTCEAIAHARALIDAYERGIALGSGAVLFEGRMIDKPVAERAYRLLARNPVSAE
jgi:citrate lyase subunit beta/citryl-CoA lyase